MEAISKTDNNRVLYYDLLRIIAMMAVVFIHVASDNWNNVEGGVNQSIWIVFNIYDSLFRWGVPVFVMISGALFLEKNINLSTIFKKYIFKMVIAFSFWSLLYSIVENIEHMNAFDVLYDFIAGPSHLWFLYMICGLYLIVPLLNSMIKGNSDALKYFVILSVIFTFVLPTVFKFPQLCDGSKLLDKMSFHITLGYSSYFVIGYYLSKVNIKKKVRVLIYILGILGFIMISALSFWISLKNGKPTSTFYDYLSVGVLFESVAIFVFVKNITNDCSKIASITIKYVSECTFGVYLVHPLVIHFLKCVFSLDTLSFNPIISVPLLAFLVSIISFGITIVIRKIPFLKRCV